MQGKLGTNLGAERLVNQTLKVKPIAEGSTLSYSQQRRLVIDEASHDKLTPLKISQLIRTMTISII